MAKQPTNGAPVQPKKAAAQPAAQPAAAPAAKKGVEKNPPARKIERKKPGISIARPVMAAVVIGGGIVAWNMFSGPKPNPVQEQYRQASEEITTREQADPAFAVYKQQQEKIRKTVEDILRANGVCKKDSMDAVWKLDSGCNANYFINTTEAVQSFTDLDNRKPGTGTMMRGMEFVLHYALANTNYDTNAARLKFSFNPLDKEYGMSLYLKGPANLPAELSRSIAQIKDAVGLPDFFRQCDDTGYQRQVEQNQRRNCTRLDGGKEVSYSIAQNGFFPDRPKLFVVSNTGKLPIHRP